MKIRIVPHQLKPQTHEISAEDVAAIRRWERDGSHTPASIGWDSLTDDQQADAETAIAWKCHDVNHYELIDA